MRRADADVLRELDEIARLVAVLKRHYLSAVQVSEEVNLPSGWNTDGGGRSSAISDPTANIALNRTRLGNSSRLSSIRKATKASAVYLHAAVVNQAIIRETPG
jgi:hypothetical protein